MAMVCIPKLTPFSQLTLAFAAMLIASVVHGETINVADYGIRPGADVTLQVNQLIESLSDKRDVTLEFPKGQYDFYPENATETYRTVANHDNGLKRMAFPMFDCHGITIDGGGSTFMFHGRLIPFTVERCNDVTLRNFSIDWIRSFHAELDVVQSDPKAKSFVVEIDQTKYPYVVENGTLLFDRFGQKDPIGSNIVFDPTTSAPIHRTNLYKVNSKKAVATSIGDNRLRIENCVKVPPPAGSVLVVYGVHPTSRLCHAMQVTNSKDVSIENVTVHDAGGMALIAERTENVTLDRMTVTSNKQRFASTRADATHFIGCRGTILLKDCLFEHMLDDGVNVHGAYVRVEKNLGRCELLCEISHFQQWGLVFAKPGDRVALLSRETLLAFAESIVEKVRVLNERRLIITLVTPPESMPSEPISVENLTWYPDLIMRGNTIRQNRARSVLVTTKGNVVIEDNHFASQMHGILIEGDNNKWYESGGVSDVVIRNNVFENIGFAVSQRYPLLASPLLTSAQRLGEGHFHQNIRFSDNTINSFNGLIAKATSVDGLTITGNRVTLSQTYPVANEGPAVVIDYCKNVVVSDNVGVGFERDLEIEVASDSSNVVAPSRVPTVN